MNDISDEFENGVLKKSKEVFVSILTDSGSTLSPSTSSKSHASEAFQSRVHQKRITLANIDRSRPVPLPNSLAAKKIQKRNSRLIKKTKTNSPQTQNSIAEKIEKEFGQSRKPLSKRQRKRFGLDGIDENINFDSLLNVHNLWLGYVQRLLGLIDANGKVNKSFLSPSQNADGKGKGKASTSTEAILNESTSVSPANQLSLQSVIVKADFVGAPIRVVRALNPSLVGIRGLVAKESESTFQIVIEPNQTNRTSIRKSSDSIKTIPKQNTVFVVQVAIPIEHESSSSPSNQPFSKEVANLEFTLYGNQLRNSLPTRATKKFKARKTIELG